MKNNETHKQEKAALEELQRRFFLCFQNPSYPLPNNGKGI